MDNRDRDKISRNTGSTEAGDLNRKTSQNIGRDKSGSSAEFGQKIGRSEEDIDNESSRQSDSVGSGGMQSDTGRSSGSSGFDSDSRSSDSSNLGENVSGSEVKRKSGNRGGGIGSREDH